MTSTRTAKATTCLYSGEMTAALSSVISPMITAPIIAPYGLPAPPRIDAAMIGIRNSEPLATENEFGVHAGDRARDATERAGDEPREIDHPGGGDAAVAGEGRVGGGGAHRLAQPGESEQCVMASITTTATPMIANCSAVSAIDPTWYVAPGFW